MIVYVSFALAGWFIGLAVARRERDERLAADLHTASSDLRRAIQSNTPSDSTRQTAAEQERSHMNPIIGTLPTEVRDAVGAMKSATVLIAGFKDRQQAAIDKALENGATAEQLAPLTDLQAELDSTTNELAEAVAANSEPPAPPAES